MQTYKEADGTIWAPMRAESEDGETIGDAMVPLKPGDPMYDEYDEWLTKQEQRRVKIDIRDEYPQKWRDDAAAAGAEMP